MTEEVIPEMRRVICDCCQREVNKQGVWRKQSGKLMLIRDLLDYQGSPCASGNITLDLCDNCLKRISDAINSACVSVRSDVAKATGNEK